MAFKKPEITKIEPNIKNLSIYLRSTKKWGKTTLFRNMILEKYGDPARGLLVGCGREKGYKMLDNLNATQIMSYKDAIDLKDWLITTKGKEHNIEIVAFDTGDELVLLADKETIKQSNIENPNKKVKSIKAAMGGFTAGEKYSANDLIKPYLGELMDAGFGVWVICHTKFKTIKEKGSLDEEGYMQLTSNLSSDYESAFGDIFDVVLTGIVDREFDEKTSQAPDGKTKTKRYISDSSRKLYFRETPLIDAGGRFADGAVPEYMVFEKGENNAAKFLQIVEEGMEKSKYDFSKNKKKVTKKAPAPVEEKEEVTEENVNDDDTVPFDTDASEVDFDDLRTQIRNMVRGDKTLAKQVKTITKEHGYTKIDEIDDIDVLNEILALGE